MEGLFKAAAVLKRRGFDDEAEAVYGAISDKIHDMNTRVPIKYSILGGVTGLVIGSVVVPGTWLPLGIAGAAVGFAVSKSVSDVRAEKLRYRLLLELGN